MKMNKFKAVSLAIVCFVSGVVVTFEWLGHDRGRRIYTMLKRPTTVIKEVEIIKIKPIIVSDEISILAVNNVYRETLVKVSGMLYDGNSPKKKWAIMQNHIQNALEFPEMLISGDK